MTNTKDQKKQSDFNNYKQVRNEVTFQIRKAKNEEIHKLKIKLKGPNICQKDWWKTKKKNHKTRSSIFHTAPEK